MNRVKAQALFACLLIFSSFIVGLTIAQTPPPANTIQHGEGANMPTVTSQYGYFYGIPPVNITDRLFGDYTGLPLTGTTLDTGQGANELYGMNQDVTTTSSPTFVNLTLSGDHLNGYNLTEHLGYDVTEASYVVWSDGLTPSTYYAKNGMTGRIDFSGTSYGALMRSLDVEGNYIQIKNGNYEVESDIRITQDNVVVEGESWNTVLTPKDQPGVVTLTAGVNIGDTILPVSSTVGFSVGEQIEINVVGVLSEQKYIQSIGVNTLIVTPLTKAHNLGVTVTSIMSTFYVTGDGCSIRNLKIDGNRINWPNLVADCGSSYEIDYYNGHDFLVERVEITNSRIRPFRGRGQRTVISQCYFHDMRSSGGIHIEGVVTGRFSYITVSDSTFIMPSGIGATVPSFMSSYGDYIKISNCYFYGGLTLRFSNNSVVSNCVFIPNDAAITTDAGLSVIGSESVTIDNNILDGAELYVKEDTVDAVLYEVKNLVVSNNQFNSGGWIVIIAGTENIQIESNAFKDVAGKSAIGGSGVTGLSISNNQFYNCTGGGTYVVSLGTITGLNFIGNTQNGCSSNNFNKCTNINLKNNIINSPTTHAFRIIDSQEVEIIGNQVINSGFRGISLESATTAPTTPIRIGYNFLDATTLYLNDGTYLNVQFPTITFAFIQGTTFISTAANPWGWEIDANAEYAVATGHLPRELQRVVNIKVYAVGLVAPGAGNYMRAQFTGEGAAPDEAYTTEPIDVVDKNNSEVNFTVNDIISWVLTATNDADIGHLRGGDSLQFMVLHEGAGGTDIETDAVFRYVIVEYV